MIFGSIEDLTIKFIEDLRKNRLYIQFIYYNFNPNVKSILAPKNSKFDSTSVILYTYLKDYDKFIEPKDTMQRSSIKEKELCMTFDKKSLPPKRQKVFIRQYNNVKSDQLKKKNLSKYYLSNSFLEKNVLFF